MVSYLNTAIAEAYNHHTDVYLKALINKELKQEMVGTGGLIAVNTGEGDVPRAFVPQVIHQLDGVNTTGRTIAMIDLNKIRSEEQDLRHTMLILTAAWESGDTVLETTRKFLTKAYSTWVTRTVERRFGIPVQDSIPFKVLMATYFWCAYTTPAKTLPIPVSLQAISDSTGVPAYKVDEYLRQHRLHDKDDPLYISDIVRMAGDISPEVKAKISASSLMATVSSSWFNETGAYYCNLALEYPPAFATLAYYGLANSGYQRTFLGEVVKRYSAGRKGEQGNNYIRDLSQLIAGLLKAGR